MTGLSKIQGNRPLPSRRLLPRQSGCHSRMRSHGIPLRSPASVLLLFFLSSSFCRVVKNKKTISNRKRSTSTAKMRENAPVSQYADFACNLCVHVPEHFSLIFAKLAIPQKFLNTFSRNVSVSFNAFSLSLTCSSVSLICLSVTLICLSVSLILFICSSDLFSCLSDLFICRSDLFICLFDLFIDLSDLFICLSDRLRLYFDF